VLRPLADVFWKQFAETLNKQPTSLHYYRDVPELFVRITTDLAAWPHLVVATAELTSYDQRFDALLQGTEFVPRLVSVTSDAIDFLSVRMRDFMFHVDSAIWIGSPDFRARFAECYGPAIARIAAGEDIGMMLRQMIFVLAAFQHPLMVDGLIKTAAVRMPDLLDREPYLAIRLLTMLLSHCIATPKEVGSVDFTRLVPADWFSSFDANAARELCGRRIRLGKMKRGEMIDFNFPGVFKMLSGFYDLDRVMQVGLIDFFLELLAVRGLDFDAFIPAMDWAAQTVRRRTGNKPGLNEMLKMALRGESREAEDICGPAALFLEFTKQLDVTRWELAKL
jgi:hypothetical protein